MRRQRKEIVPFVEWKNKKWNKNRTGKRVRNERTEQKMRVRFNRERVRFDAEQPDTLVIQGWLDETAMGERERECLPAETESEQAKNLFYAEQNGRETALTVQTQSGVEVTKKYLRYKTNVTTEYFLRIPLQRPFQPLRVYRKTEEGSTCIYRASSRELSRLSTQLLSWMEKLSTLPNGTYQLRGWYIGSEHARITLKEKNGAVLKTECIESPRMDILGEFPEVKREETHGFELKFQQPAKNELQLVLEADGKQCVYSVNCRKMLSDKEDLKVLYEKSVLYLKRKGMRQFLKRLADEVKGKDSISYERWQKKYGTGKKELAAQRQHTFAYSPKISIVIPLYRTPERFLKEVIQSVEQQTYQNWELVLSDGSGENSPLDGFLNELEQRYQNEHPGKLKVVRNHAQLRISENTNAAIEAATGEFLAFGDHDDLFALDALYECVRLLNQKPETELIYTDEDKVDGRGKKYFQPHFKSDYNPDLLCSMNYFCHLVVVKRELADRAGWLDPAYDGAQDYDFVLRCTEQTDPEKIGHIAKILYHWRCHQDSTAENPESKQYAFTAGCRAVQAHYDRRGIRASVKEGMYPGLYESDYEILGTPLISILIPNKDHLSDLETCIRSITEQSDYPNFEILIIENNSTEPETFEGYRRLEEDERIHVVYYKGDFNYSAINNFGAAYAKGDYFLLLNNDTEMIRADGLRQLLGVCQRSDVGVVGARLYYDDDTIQHAGVVLGFGGIAGHAFIGQKRSDNGYFSQILCMRDYSAVTAACLMVKASVYREVEGLTEELKVAFNDIDFCMKVRKAGYLVVYNPRAEWYHYESKSRGLENTQEKIERFNGEVAQFLDRWGDQVKAGDPYYNPNLSLDKADFSIKI